MDIDPTPFNERMAGTLSTLLGLRIVEASPERVVAELTIRDELRTVGGALHGGTLMALADTVGAAATIVNLPAGRGHDHARVEDQLLRGRPLRRGARGGHPAAPGQAHPGVADARDRRVRPAPLPDDPDPDGAVKVAFAGVFAGHVADRVRARLRIPCEVALADDREILARLGDVDVLVSMAFTPRDGRGRPAPAPGAGAGRGARPHRPRRARAGHRAGQRVWPRRRHRGVRDRRDARGHPELLSGRRRSAPGALGQRVVGRAGAALAGAGRQDPGHPRLRPHRPGGRPAGAGLRHGRAGDPARRGPARSEPARVPARPGGTRRGAGARGLPGHHAGAHARHARAHRRAAARADEAHRGAGQRGARRGGGRGRALRRAPPAARSRAPRSTSGIATRRAPRRSIPAIARSTSCRTC